MKLNLFQQYETHRNPKGFHNSIPNSMTSDQQKQLQKEREQAFLIKTEKQLDSLMDTIKYSPDPLHKRKVIKNYLELAYNYGVFDGVSVAHDIDKVVETTVKQKLAQ